MTDASGVMDGVQERASVLAALGLDPDYRSTPQGLDLDSDKVGIMVCGHGSRSKDAVTQFAAVVDRLKARFAPIPVEYGYLEFAKPVIRDGLDSLRAQGCTRILAIPGMLFAAGHAKNDIPSVLNTYQAENQDTSIHYGRELAIDLKMIRAAGERVAEAVGDLSAEERAQTLLVTVGRGASDPDANSNVSKVMRMLWEGMGFGWGEVAYSGVTFPLVEPALEHAAKLGYRRIVVFPYFLFTGILVKRIYDHTDIVAARHPEIEFIKAPYLNDHPLVVETMADRVREIVEGANTMNCQMCKYREQVLGFEAEVGLPQESHHHHVEGLGTVEDCSLCDTECTGACREAAHTHAHEHGHGHDHGHHHHPYPHADHPLGPKSLERLKR